MSSGRVRILSMARKGLVSGLTSLLSTVRALLVEASLNMYRKAIVFQSSYLKHTCYWFFIATAFRSMFGVRKVSVVPVI